MNKRLPAIISTVSNSFNDFTLDFAVNKYNMYFVLFGTVLGSFIIQLVYGIISGIVITSSSIIYIIIYGLCILLGYVLYVHSLKRLPVALTGLIESGSLFAYLLIDCFCGYFKINLWFIFLFICFMLSVFLFSYDTYQHRDNSNKKIRFSGIVILLFSMLFYGLAPYLIKFASSHGANEIGINMGYYLFAIPYFFIMILKNKNKVKIDTKRSGILKFILLISIFEAIYYLFGTMGYANESAIINEIIQEIRVFLLFILSTIFGTDKMSLKKMFSIIIGVLSVIGIYLY